MMRAFSLALVIATLPAGAAQAATEISTSDRLQDRREVAAGDRAYAGGLPGRRLVRQRLAHHRRDGRHLGASAQARGRRLVRRRRPVGRPATRFTSGRGYVRYDLPSIGGLKLTRTDFVPDGVRATLIGLTLTSTESLIRPHSVKIDVHSELAHRLPVGRQQGPPHRRRQRPGHRRGRGACARVPRRCAHRLRRLESPALRHRHRSGLPRPANGFRLPGRRPAGTVGLRRRAVRARRRWAAPLQHSDDARRARDRVDRGRGDARRPRRRAGLPGHAAAREDPHARACRNATASTCPATAACRRPSTTASRTWPISPRPRPTFRSASSTRARHDRGHVARREGAQPARRRRAPAGDGTGRQCSSTAATWIAPRSCARPTAGSRRWSASPLAGGTS